MKGQALKIFSSKYFIWPATCISLLVISIIVYFAGIKDIMIFPERANLKYEFYTDKPNGGNSRILTHIVSDSLLQVKFLLGNGFSSPYIGLTITPLNKKYIDAVNHNEINLQIMGQNIDRIGVSFFTEPQNKEQYRNLDEMLFHSYLNISNLKKTYKIPLKHFEHPEWWEDLHHLPESEKNKPDLGRIQHINIGSAFSPELDKEKTIEIYSITITRNNRKLFTFLVLIYLVALLSLFGILYLVILRKIKASEVTVAYKPLDIPTGKSGMERCLEFINSNYSNNNLSLTLISKETAVTSRRITSIIYEKYNCNFKTYLNRIRINESKRLLTETELTIGEIAYKVGFNTQSHFNRVFKKEISLSPTEYRTLKIH